MGKTSIEGVSSTGHHMLARCFSPVKWVVDWVMEPIQFQPLVVDDHELNYVIEHAAQSPIESYYLEVVARGDVEEINKCITHLQAKIKQDQAILKQGKRGRLATQYQMRSEHISATLVQHLDTLQLLEERLVELTLKQQMPNNEATAQAVAA